MNLVITPRDKDLFKYLYENKVGTRIQIARDVFKNIKRQTICRRLKKLCFHKYIDFRSAILETKAKHIYSITQKGVDVIKNEYRHLITEKIKKSDSQNHDLDLVDIRHVIEGFKIVKNYFTENILSSCTHFSKSECFSQFVNLRSDGVVEIETQNGSFLVALEYDSSDKAPDRYRKKISEYYFSKKVRAVLYICGNKPILNLLRKIDTEICKDGFVPKIFYILKENAQRHVKELTFENINGDIFKLF